jgi:TatD DNase family protein
LIDTHAHIDADIFDEDREEMIAQAFANGVKAIIIPAIEPNRYDGVLSICNQYDNIYCGMGVHPHNANDYSNEVEERIISSLSMAKVKAVGEIGLDYYYDFAPKNIQKDVFHRQLNIAKSHDFPVIIHNRESDDDMLEILQEEQTGELKGVLHCFSSDLTMLHKALDLGFHISFTGNITYKKSILDEIVRATPLDKIMIETDSPYMTPVPHRGKRNEPQFVRFIAQKIADIHALTLEEIITMTSNNAKSLFRLPLFLIVFLFGLSTFPIIAQDDRNEEDTEEQVQSIEKNPYARFIGFGPSLATNTIVETLTDIDRPERRDTRSWDGNPALGFSVAYNPLEFLMLEAGILHTRNNAKLKNALPVPGTPTDPDVYTVFNITARAIANPRSKVAFFALGGINFQSKRIHSTNVLFTDDSQLAFNAGAGFMVNIPTSFGMIIPIAEWRLDFESKNDTINLPNEQKYKDWGDIEISTFYSLPRLTILWYPKF